MSPCTEANFKFAIKTLLLSIIINLSSYVRYLIFLRLPIKLSIVYIIHLVTLNCSCTLM